MERRTDPRSRLLPPVVYLGATLLGVGVQRGWPVGLLPLPVGRWLGGTVLVGSVALAALAVRLFHRAGTPPNPTKDVTALVRSGPYRLSRNPMYLSLALFQAGVAFALDNAWVLILLALSFGIMDRIVVPGEERYMASRYGADYAEYMARVRRWL
jgi:protein-S-isoprenylcysteine O-methyltransferase Ste14